MVWFSSALSRDLLNFSPPPVFAASFFWSLNPTTPPLATDSFFAAIPAAIFFIASSDIPLLPAALSSLSFFFAADIPRSWCSDLRGSNFVTLNPPPPPASACDLPVFNAAMISCSNFSEWISCV